VLPGNTFTAERIARILIRRRWLILVPFALGLAAAPLISKLVPKVYRSETLIMVVPQRVPDSYVKPTITASMEDRLPSINEQILSRSRLERVIRELGLYPELRPGAVMEDIVQRMRNDIVVKLEGRDSFRVSYLSRDPKTAQSVTERLASWYIEENLRDRENQAEGTNRFLESQLEDAKRRLVQHEKKLEEYRRRYAGQLPTQLQSNLQVIQNVQLQLQSLEESTNRARERRLLFERQIADLQALPAALNQPGAGGGPGVQSPPLTLAQQLEAAQVRLEDFRRRYTPDHPDVRALERTIRELQEAVKQEAARPPDTTAAPVLMPAEAARQKQLRGLQAEMEVIDHQIAANEAEKKRLMETNAAYQSKVDVVPTRESELVELTRDYSTLQATYASLLAKKEDSKLAANLERRQVGEQFRVLDPASLPERPYNRRERLAFTALGAVGGLVLGLLWAAWLEYRDTSFNAEDEVIRVLDLPVLALVPVMRSEQARVRNRRKRWLIDIAALLVIIGSAAVLIIWRAQL
jgi:protein tyrosine kinase modulator